ncbi:T9SS type B sorting domain-containing protein, partial [Flaviaesturariibacter terrae]
TDTTVLHLTIASGLHSDTTATACGSYQWNGQTYTTSGDYSFTTTNGACTDTTVLHLTIASGLHSDTTATACGSYQWHGQTYTTSGDYSFTTTNGACTDTTVLHLTIASGLHSDTTATACAQFIWHGQTYTSSGDYSFTAPNGACTDTTVLHLTIANGTHTDTTATACAQYAWHGQTYTTSGDYSFTTPNGACTDTTVLHLTIANGTHTDTTATACGSYQWHGQTYTTSGDYSFTTTNGACTDTTVLHLTIASGLHSDTTATACGSYQWHGQTYTTSGDYSFTTTNGACTDTTVLHLTIASGLHSDTTATACGSYQWHGQTYTASGDYPFYATNGSCQDTVVLHLTIASGLHSDTTATACAQFIWHGQTYTTSGDYNYYLSGPGCTDTTVLHLTITNGGTRTDTTATSCNPFDWYGVTYPESGTYYHITQDPAGCPDSIVLHLSINAPNLRINDPAITCNQPTVDLTAPAITAGSSPGLSYSYWMNPGATQPLPNPNAVSNSGICYIKGSGASGCHRVSPVNVRISNMSLTADAQAATCSGATGSISVNASNGVPPYRYSLDGSNYQPSRIFNNLAAGTYTVYVQDGGGCVGQLQVTLEGSISARIEGGGSLCSGSSDTLRVYCTGSGPWTLVYSEGSVQHSISGISASPYLIAVTPAGSTTYSLVSIANAQCSNNSLNSSATISVAPAITGVRYPTEMAESDTPKQLQARNLGANCSYQWAPPTGLNLTTVYNPVFRHNQDQEYLIRISNGTGCSTVDTVLVQIRNSTTQSIHSDIFVPKAWSPNNDGHNDRLYPLTVHIRELYYFRIFNRWGQLMFETNIIGAGWDGLFKGLPQVNDTYTWTLEAVGEDGKYYKRSGNSVLLR